MTDLAGIVNGTVRATRLNMTTKMFLNDLRVCLALEAANNRARAERRAAAQSNHELCAILSADAARRGQSTIDWPEYFRNADMN